MAIIRFLSSTSNDPASLVKIYNYVNDKDKNRVHAVGSTYFPPDKWLESVQALKKLNGKNEMRQYTHGVLSMGDNDGVNDVGTLKRIMDEVTSLFEGIPAYYSIHTNTAHIHAHFINSATGLDGLQKGMNKTMFNDFMNKAGDILESYYCQRPIPESIIDYDGKEEEDMSKFFEVEPDIPETPIDEYEIVGMPKKTGNTAKKQNVEVVAEQEYDEDDNCFYQVPAIVNHTYPQQYSSWYYAPQTQQMQYNGGYYTPQPQQMLYNSGNYSPQIVQQERNRIYVNNSPEVECSNMEQAQEVISQMNTMCAQFAQAAIQAGQNGLPNDIVLNFNPKIKFGKD